jgi:hypothetical protein
VSRIRHKWHKRPLHGQMLPVLLSARSSIFTMTTMPGAITQPLPIIDVSKLKTQPLPAISRDQKRKVTKKRRYPKQMFWWSLIFIIAGYAALLWAKSVIGLVVCEWIGLACSGLWMIDMLVILLFRG